MTKKTDDMTSKSLREKIKKSPRLLVVYSATWCGPCKAYHPVVERFAKLGLIEVLEIDVDEHTDLCKDIESVPHTRFYKNGKIVRVFSGGVTLKGLQAFTEEK